MHSPPLFLINLRINEWQMYATSSLVTTIQVDSNIRSVGIRKALAAARMNGNKKN